MERARELALKDERPNAALLVGRNWHLLRALAVPIVTTIAVIAALRGPPSEGGAMTLLAVPAALFLAKLLWSQPRARRGRGALAVEGDVLTLDGRAIARTSELRAGYVVPGAPEGTLLRLERSGLASPVDLVVPDVHVGRATLAELGLDARRVAARFSVRAMSAQTFTKRTKTLRLLALLVPAVVLGASFAGFGTLPWAIAAFVTALVVHALVFTYPTFLTVGTDGIVARKLGRERFIPLSSIADVELVEGERIVNDVPVVMRLVGHDGAVLEDVLVDVKRGWPADEGTHARIEARAAALAERILAAIELRRRDDGSSIDPRALARSGRSTAEWIAELRSLLDGRETFRDAAPPSADALLAIVEDPSADPAVRAAAAVAAKASGEAAHARIRVAAEATAAPKLRLALEAALEDDPARLEAAMDELDRLTIRQAD